MNVERQSQSRRGFLLGAASGATLAWARVLAAEPPPPVVNPRATARDSVEPDWQRRLAITVGPAGADLVGGDHRALQAAVDYVARLGGGTVRVLPGTYRMRGAVHLRSGVRIAGSGEDSILLKEPSTTSKLAEDSDWFDQEITLADGGGFRLGDDVCLRTTNPHHGGTDVVKRTLVARSGNRFKLDRSLEKNFWIAGETTVSTLFALLDGEEVADVRIENLTLDGNRENNENLNGNYAGCIFLQYCNRVAIRGVTARRYNGDGISWQVCHDVAVEDCRSRDHAGLGLHPGSGSQRPIIRNNHLQRNSIGLFFCWGVKFGLAEGNTIEDSSQSGISIGHHDTDNLIVGNTVRRSGRVGVLFRPGRSKGFAPHRNRLQRNTIEDSGPEEGVAVDVQGETENVVLAENRLAETRAPAARTGIRLGAKTGKITLRDNHITGFAKEIEDLRDSREETHR